MTSFHEFAAERWGPNWGLCHATAANKARYNRCVSQKEYEQALKDFRREHTVEALRHYPMADYGDVAADLFVALQKCRAYIAREDDADDMAECLEAADAAIAKAIA